MSSMIVHLFNKVAMATCILLVIYNSIVEGKKINNSSYLKSGFENHLKPLKKPPVKSIKSLDGDIIDCVLLANQPTLDHPLLKNHTIQMRPNYIPKSIFLANEKHMKRSKPITQLWHLNGECPEGTIPIRRTKGDYIDKGSSTRTFRRMGHHTTIFNDPAANRQQGEFAIAYMNQAKYFGAQATINVWKPKVQESSEFSSSQIWIQGGVDNHNSIEAGWQVYPTLYKDNNTRFFTYWINKGFKGRGCFDLRCPGFIQINNKIALGGAILPLSSYGGAQYDITITIWKDPQTGYWWLGSGKEINLIGYWASGLLPELYDGASTIIWGGEIANIKSGEQHTTTQMGSGHFPNEASRKASYFKDIKYVDGSNFLKNPTNIKNFSSQSNCYDIKYGKLHDGNAYFFYGGPGRNPNCP